MALTIDDDVPPIGDQPDLPIAPINQDERLCLECGFPIEYQPGRRRGKWHPECKPVGATTTRTNGGRATSIDTLIEQIATLYRNLGMGVTFVPGMALDGMAVTSEASKLAESWRPLIVKDPKIRKAWEKITTGSGWGTVVMAHAGIALTIAANHGVNLPGMVTVPVVDQPQKPDPGGTYNGLPTD